MDIHKKLQYLEDCYKSSLSDNEEETNSIYWIDKRSLREIEYLLLNAKLKLEEKDEKIRDYMRICGYLFIILLFLLSCIFLASLVVFFF